MFRPAITATVGAMLLAFSPQLAFSQAFGPELRNTVMPASGGMGGASMARPQDLQSAINGNPATLTQFRGTQFGFSGAWIEPTFNWRQSGGNLPNIGDFAAKSEAEGAALGNIGVTQDFSALGLPLTVGLGMVGSSGAGLSYRDVPESNGTSALVQVLGIGAAAGVQVTDRLALGATIMMGAAVLDAPFVGIGAATTDYSLRGVLGMTYDVRCQTTVGLTYFTKQSFNFDDAISLQLPGGGFGTVQDIDMGMPDIVALAVADESLFCGKLLVAIDVLYFNWDNADLFRPIFDKQWALQVGTQYKLTDRIRLRLGYVYAENATQADPGGSAGGIVPPVVDEAIRYLQAQFPNINQHRISAGIGIRDVLPGMDMNLFAGGMPRVSQEYGPFTAVDLESYWVGFGMTWRFGRGSCSPLPVADDWGGGGSSCTAGCTSSRPL
jgi:long-chain fatty acid transport protein